MPSANGKLKVGMYWAASCGGCDISLLEIGPRLLELLQIAEVVFWPCAADFKYANVVGYPDAFIDLCLFNGGVRNSEQEEVARLLRKKSKSLIAYGACASGGGIPALANLKSRDAIFDAAYHHNPSTQNPEGTEPQPLVETPLGELEIPEFYPAVLRLRDVVPVDYELPGCPPQADRVWEAVQAVAGGAVPLRNAGLKVGCTDKTVCDECSREKKQAKIARFKRHHQVRPEPGWCLLEQGLLCMGPATRGGCGALCLKADMPCEGCYGPPPSAEDQATSMMGALGALLDATTEERARELVAEIPDPVGGFARFSLASGYLKVAK